MKVFKYFLLFLVLYSCNTKKSLNEKDSHYSIPVHQYIDENAQVISEKEFNKKLKEKENVLARWDYVEDEKRIASLSSPLYERGQVRYEILLSEIKKLTHRNFPDNTTFIIGYTFKDDLCTGDFSNDLDKKIIRGRKFSKGISEKRHVENKIENLIFLRFFEKGIYLENQPEDKDEFFFSDKEEFFRKNFFRFPTICGSYMVVKPTGEALIRNGEYRAEGMAAHLKPETWIPFFATTK